MRARGPAVFLPLFLFLAIPAIGWAAPNQCTAVFKFDREFAWQKLEVQRFGPQKGAPLTKARNSSKVLSPQEIRDLGLPENSRYLYFYNFSDAGGKKWIARYDRGSIASATFGVERFSTNGEEYFHSLISLKLNPEHPLHIYEQTDQGIGHEKTTDEVVLTVAFQVREGEAPTPLGTDQAMSFYVNDMERQLERQQKKGIKMQWQDLKMDSDETDSLLRNFLNNATQEGGVARFDFVTNNCTSKLVEIIWQSLKHPPRWRSARDRQASDSAKLILGILTDYGVVDRNSH